MKKVIVISSALLGVIFLTGCGKQSMNQTQPIDSTVQTSVDKKESLQTYSNDKYGFEFMHLSDMKIVDRDDPSSLFFDFQNFSLEIAVFDKNGKSIDTYLADPRSLFLFYPSSKYLTVEKETILQNKSDLIVGEKEIACPKGVPLEALCYLEKVNSDLFGLAYYYFVMNDSYAKWVVLFNSDGNRYLLSASPHQEHFEDIKEFKEKSTNDLADFNNILSTFKFIKFKRSTKCDSNAECCTDVDCEKNTSGGDNIGMSIYPPCYKGKCEYPKSSKEWIEYCDVVGSNARNPYIWNCYMNAAYDALKKSSFLNNYTIEWDDAFKICEQYISDQSEECKLDVCQNLSLGDGNMKYNYPEEEQCNKDAVKNSS